MIFFILPTRKILDVACWQAIPHPDFNKSLNFSNIIYIFWLSGRKYWFLYPPPSTIPTISPFSFAPWWCLLYSPPEAHCDSQWYALFSLAYDLWHFKIILDVVWEWVLFEFKSLPNLVKKKRFFTLCHSGIYVEGFVFSALLFIVITFNRPTKSWEQEVQRICGFRSKLMAQASRSAQERRNPHHVNM